MQERVYIGYVDPSLYAVMINAKQCGWIPRPPSIPLTTPQKVFTKLKQTSSMVSEDGTLDLRFAASLHERKHFMDLHLSSILWRYFLSWFHCSANIFILINCLKEKKIQLPLYTPLGILRPGNPFNRDERRLIGKICSQIFENNLNEPFKHALEVSASLLQYSCFSDRYNISNYYEFSPIEFYKAYFEKPLRLFSNNIERAFSCYTFLSWFCLGQKEFYKLEKKFQSDPNYKDIVYSLLKDRFYARKQHEIEQDLKYIKTFSENWARPITKFVPDLVDFLSKLISFRQNLFSSIDQIVELITDISYFKQWSVEEALKTYYLVDFGNPLLLDTEITENYHASKWIVENQQYLYYDDQLGTKIIEMDDFDNFINMQLLSSFLVSPVRLFPFTTRTASEEFLECRFINYLS